MSESGVVVVVSKFMFKSRILSNFKPRESSYNEHLDVCRELTELISKVVVFSENFKPKQLERDVLDQQIDKLSKTRLILETNDCSLWATLLFMGLDKVSLAEVLIWR